MTDDQTVTVTIPHQIRDRAGGQRSVDVQATTVREAIHAIDRTYPGLTFNLCYETGELRPFVNIFVRQENIKYLQGLDTELTPGETVHVIHSVAGG